MLKNIPTKSQRVCHYMHKSARGISCAKRYNQPLIKIIFCFKSIFLLITLANPNVVIPTLQINLRNYCSTIISNILSSLGRESITSSWFYWWHDYLCTSVKSNLSQESRRILREEALLLTSKVQHAQYNSSYNEVSLERTLSGWNLWHIECPVEVTGQVGPQGRHIETPEGTIGLQRGLLLGSSMEPP